MGGGCDLSASRPRLRSRATIAAMAACYDNPGLKGAVRIRLPTHCPPSKHLSFGMRILAQAPESILPMEVMD